MAFSSYPYPFALGQLGQPGQTPETIANRALRASILHNYTGPRLGHAGPIQFQDVSGQAQRRIDRRAPLSRVVRFRGFSGRSQARPSAPPRPLVGVVRQGFEAFAAAQQVGRGGIGSAGDQLTAGGRQASAIAPQVATLSTASPVVSQPLAGVNARKPGRRGCSLACRRRSRSRFDMRRGLHVATG